MVQQQPAKRMRSEHANWLIHDPVRNEFYRDVTSTSGDSQLLPMDIFEGENDYRAVADVPGLNPDDLDLTVENQSIIIKAERKMEQWGEKDKVHRSERTFGSVTKRLVLPKDADMSLARTHFSNGVLTVTVPKHKELPPATTKLVINTE